MKKIEIYDHGRILPFLFLFGHEKVSSSVLESRIGSECMKMEGLCVSTDLLEVKNKESR
jgi:hypothetical protein